VKLTRAQQNSILLGCVLAARTAARHVLDHPRFGPTLIADRNTIRSDLRLDDPALDALIESGAYRHPWNSPTDKERMACFSGH
jgi:hypothetical protein